MVVVMVLVVVLIAPGDGVAHSGGVGEQLLPVGVQE